MANADSSSPASQLCELIAMLEKLCDPVTGSAWEKRQTHESLAPNLSEEASEAIEALERGSAAQRCDELGDVLLQVVFHAQIAKNNGTFTLEDIAAGVASKLRTRLPAFFAGRQVSEREQLEQWEAQKAKQRAASGPAGSCLDGVSAALAALARAQKLQDRVGHEGFIWTELAPIVKKFEEEWQETRDAMQNGAHAAIAEELGDLLAVTVSLAKYHGLDAEQLMRQNNAKFEARCRSVETALKARGKALRDATLAEMQACWNEHKQQERSA